MTDVLVRRTMSELEAWMKFSHANDDTPAIITDDVYPLCEHVKLDGLSGNGGTIQRWDELIIDFVDGEGRCQLCWQEYRRSESSKPPTSLVQP